MPKKLNHLEREELKKTFGGLAGGVLVNYQGLPSEETYALRKELHQKKIQMRVVKNSLAERAFQELGIELGLKGPVAICTNDDPPAVAKALVEYRKKNKKTKLEIKGGLLGKKVLDAKEVSDLAQLPGKDQLRAQVVGTLAAPIRGLAMAAAGILRKLLYGLNAIKEQKEKQGGTAAAPAAQ
jgi:large subunit ribosomal protein L10